MKRIYILVIGALLYVNDVVAQNGTTNKTATQKQTWFGYFNTTEFGKKWYLYTEFENRNFFDPEAQNLFLLRTHLHYKIGKSWDIAPGFTYFLVNTQVPERPSKLYTPEVRSFQEGTYTWRSKTNKFVLANRFRVEERFIQKNVNGELADGYNFNMRFRLRIQFEVVLYKSKKEHPHTLKLRLNDEIMANIPTGVVKNAFDQNRIYAGFNYQPPGPVAFEVGYMNWFQERQTGGTYFNRHIIRFSLHHRVSFPVKKKTEEVKQP